MAQANSNLTTRRSFTTLMAATGAAMLATKTDATTLPPDARLIELGKQFDEIDRQFWRSCAKCNPLWEQLREKSDDWNKAHPHATSAQRMDEYHRLHVEIGLKAIEDSDDQPDDWTNRISPIAEEILSIPSSTLAGLSIKARVVRSQASHLWRESEDDADWDDLCIRKLVEDILLMAARNTAPVAI
jgi:hypothetical protein